LKHVLFTLYRCDVELLNDRMFIENLLYETANYCGSTFLNTVSHQFEPQGVTAVTLLAEQEMAVCDIFTCGNHTDPMKGFAYMKTALKSICSSHKFYERPFEIDGVPLEQLSYSLP
jgi:S-adenosylmethionine decarboxylase